MKIVLFTIWHVGNYGAEMQTYATVKVLKKLGHEVEVANIWLSDFQHSNINGKIGNAIQSISPGWKRMKDFWKQYIPATQRYRGMEEICLNPPEADLYLVGSDQVWNPNITGAFSELFFLPFERVKKISYASSVGTSKWIFPEEKTKEIKKLLDDFSALSCREKTGCKIISDLSRKEVKTVIDPTLLFDSYSELIGHPQQKDYIAYYPLSENKEQQACANRLSSIMGLPYKDITHKKYVCGKILWDRASIQDWIKGIAESRFVLTPSFHGLAFSLIYRREFAILVNPSKGSRIWDLLDMVGLKDRAFTSVDSFLKSKIWNTPIDYFSVRSRLDKHRKDSIDFLVDNLV